MRLNKEMHNINRTILHVCFDLDRTLVDDSGDALRPGIRELLDSLMAHGITLSLWTASTRSRAMYILECHGLENHFTDCVFREDYDPGLCGHPKNIAYLNADLLVDDNAYNIIYVRQLGRRGFLLTPFISPESPPDIEEIKALHELIVPGKEWL